MDVETVKRWALLGVVGAALIGATYWYTARTHQPAVAAVTWSGCDVPRTMAGMGVPLALLGDTSAGLPVAFGPIEAGRIEMPLRIVFDPRLDGTQREVTMTDGLLALPVTFGRDAMLPERIAVTCREGAVTSVRYTGGRSAASVFNVVQAEPAALESPTAEGGTQSTM